MTSLQKAAADKAKEEGLLWPKKYRSDRDLVAFVQHNIWAESWGVPEKVFVPPPFDAGNVSDGYPDMAEQVHAREIPVVQLSTFTNKVRARAYPRSLSKDGFITFLTKHDIRQEKDGKMFAPAIFKATRSNADFTSATGLCLDFDHGQPNVEDVRSLFPDTLMAFYSTHSHLPESPRFRVVIPLSRPVEAEAHDCLTRGVQSIITPELSECLDFTCFEKARSYYLPSCPPENERHAFTGHQDGTPLDVDHFIQLGAAVAPAKATKQRGPAAAPPQSFEFIDRSTGEVHDLTAWAVLNPAFDIVSALDPQYHRGKPKDSKQHITCPFEDQHTDQGEDLATFAANASPPQFPAWDVHCRHAHCADRDRLEFLQAMLEKGWISAGHVLTAAVGTEEMKRPPRIYCPVNDILADPAWSALMPDEKQKALHLMTLMWVEDDGKINDDDWTIARNLGIPERDWKDGYRPTLERTGWLIESGGRLTNAIAKREFDLALKAYNGHLVKASRGGKVAQEKARLKKLEAPA